MKVHLIGEVMRFQVGDGQAAEGLVVGRFVDGVPMVMFAGMVWAVPETILQVEPVRGVPCVSGLALQVGGGG